MCKLIGKSKLKSFTGYKVLVVDDTGNFYSSFTGEKFEVGPVPLPPELCTRLVDNWNTLLDYFPLKECRFYNKRYEGFTSVYVHNVIDISCYKPLSDNLTTVICKVNISGDLRQSLYRDYCYSGKHVNSIEIIERLKY